MAEAKSSSMGPLGTIGALIAIIVGITTILKNCTHDPNESAYIKATSAKVERAARAIPKLEVNFENLGKNDAIEISFASAVQPTGQRSPGVDLSPQQHQSALLRHGDVTNITWLVFMWELREHAAYGGVADLYLFKGTVSWKDRITGSPGHGEWCFQTTLFDRQQIDAGRVIELESCPPPNDTK
jgi:hypothetical protein